MKKLTALLLCILLMFVCSVTAFAQTVGIDTVVPDSHTVTVNITGDATAELDGEAGTTFTVDRLSEPVLRFIPADGKQIVKITLNGEDITDKLDGDTYKLAPVYEDMTLDVQVQTENVPEQPTEQPTEAPTTPKGDNATPDQKGDNNGSGTKSDTTSPKTGDETRLTLWLMLMILCAAGMFLVFALYRRNRAAETEE